MITSRERILATFDHRTLDRIPMCETSIWPETIARWENEGLPKGVNPLDYFHLDRVGMDWFDVSFFDHVIFEETDEYIVDMNPYGTKVKYLKKGNSSSGFYELDHSVKTIDDWRKAKTRLEVSGKRLPAPANAVSGDFRVLSAPDHFWMSFCMCGMENLCCWLMEAPEEMREIYDDYLDFYIGMLDLCVKQKHEFDAVWFFSDMAYANGPMFSTRVYREVIAPGYSRLRSWCDSNNKKMLLHCDGNMNELLPEFINSRFDWIHPLEARAGNDIRKMKAAYGQDIVLVGNINADILAEGDPAKVEEEVVSKIMAAKAGGGYIYHIDHSVPPTISFKTYSFAIDLIKKAGLYQ